MAQVLDDQTLTTHSNQRDYTMPTTFVGSPERVYLGDPVSPGIEENLFDNADFEEWTGSAPDHWDTSSEITTAKEDDPYFVYSGTYSCKCTSTLLAGYFYQTVSSPTDYLGRRMSFNIWVYCTTATRVRAGILDNSGGDSGSYHTGNGWELLTVSFNVPASATYLKAGIRTSPGTVAIVFYQDDCIFWTGVRSPGTEWMPQHDWNVDSSILHFENTKTANRPIRLVGYGYLSTLSTDASTTEVDDDIYKRFLYAEAAVHLYQQLKQSAATSLTPLYEGQYNYWLNESYSRRRSCARVFQHHIKIPGWSG